MSIYACIFVRSVRVNSVCIADFNAKGTSFTMEPVNMHLVVPK